MTVREKRKELTDIISTFSDNPAFEATELIIYATEIKRSAFLINQDMPLSEAEEKRLDLLLKRRLSGEPLQYILGVWEFYGREFAVGKGVLIPRADTEILVETALDYLYSKQNPTVFDFCAGSGAIGISIKAQKNDCDVVLVEKSLSAYKYLKKNILLNNVNCKAVRKDIFKFFPKMPCDLLVCNPPYIKSEIMKTLSPEVKKEPKTALDGGNDGLMFYRKISENAERYLKHGGKIMFEIGYDEADAVKDILQRNSFFNIECYKDFGNNDRVVCADYK